MLAGGFVPCRLENAAQFVIDFWGFRRNNFRTSTASGVKSHFYVVPSQ
jgi:hypothetical protein